MDNSPYQPQPHPSFGRDGQVNENIGERPGPESYESVSRRSTGKILLYGCAGIFMGGVLLILCGGIGAFYFYKQQVNKYTADAPMDIPDVEYSEHEMTELKERIDQFGRSVQGIESKLPSDKVADTDPPAPSTAEEQDPTLRELVLTADDLNALISSEPDLKGRIFVKIDDDEITGDISVPLEGIIPGAAGRYFNGSGTFNVSFDDGELWVTLEEASVKGEPMPETFMEALQAQNLASDFSQTPAGSTFLEQFDSIEVADGKVRLTLKEPEPEPENNPQSAAAESAPTPSNELPPGAGLPPGDEQPDQDEQPGPIDDEVVVVETSGASVPQ